MSSPSGTVATYTGHADRQPVARSLSAKGRRVRRSTPRSGSDDQQKDGAPAAVLPLGQLEAGARARPAGMIDGRPWRAFRGRCGDVDTGRPVLRADELASRLGKGRSEIYREALADYVARREPGAVTRALDEIADEFAAADAKFVTEAARRMLARSEW